MVQLSNYLKKVNCNLGCCLFVKVIYKQTEALWLKEATPVTQQKSYSA